MKIQNAEMEFVRFDNSDVLTNSGGGSGIGEKVTMSGFGDGVAGNATIAYGGTEYGYSNFTKENFSTYFETLYGSRVSSYYELFNDYFLADTGGKVTVQLSNDNGLSDNSNPGSNGIFAWLTDQIYLSGCSNIGIFHRHSFRRFTIGIYSLKSVFFRQYCVKSP